MKDRQVSGSSSSVQCSVTSPSPALPCSVISVYYSSFLVSKFPQCGRRVSSTHYPVHQTNQLLDTNISRQAPSNTRA